MTDAEMTPGEIQRWLERIDKNIDALRDEVQARHHKLSNDVTSAIGPISTLTLRVTTNEGEIDKLQTEAKAIREAIVNVRLQAAGISGAIAFGGFLLGLFWRH